MFLKGFSWTRSSVAQKTQYPLQVGEYPLKEIQFAVPRPQCYLHESTGREADQEIQKHAPYLK